MRLCSRLTALWRYINFILLLLLLLLLLITWIMEVENIRQQTRLRITGTQPVCAGLAYGL